MEQLEIIESPELIPLLNRVIVSEEKVVKTAHQSISDSYISLLPGDLRLKIVENYCATIASPMSQALLQYGINPSEDKKKELTKRAFSLGREKYKEFLNSLPIDLQCHFNSRLMIKPLMEKIISGESELLRHYFDHEMQWIEQLRNAHIKAGNDKNDPLNVLSNKELFARTVFFYVDKQMASQEKLKKWGDECLLLIKPNESNRKNFASNCAIACMLFFAGLVPSLINLPNEYTPFWGCNGPWGSSINQGMVFADCYGNSTMSNVPCNATQLNLGQLRGCCNKFLLSVCGQKGEYYNEHIYPKERIDALLPLICASAGIGFVQITIQLIGLYLRRTAKIPNKETMQVINEIREQVKEKNSPI